MFMNHRWYFSWDYFIRGSTCIALYISSPQRLPRWKCDRSHSLLCCIAFGRGHNETAKNQQCGLCLFSIYPQIVFIHYISFVTVPSDKRSFPSSIIIKPNFFIEFYYPPHARITYSDSRSSERKSVLNFSVRRTLKRKDYDGAEQPSRVTSLVLSGAQSISRALSPICLEKSAKAYFPRPPMFSLLLLYSLFLSTFISCSLYSCWHDYVSAQLVGG